MPVFLDSNILLYALGDEEPKRQRARELLGALPVVGHFIPREFLRVIRADPTGFVHVFCGYLRSIWSWVGSGDPNGSNRPGAVTEHGSVRHG